MFDFLRSNPFKRLITKSGLRFQADGEDVQTCAEVQEFLAACADTQKAWDQSSLFSLTSTSAVGRLQSALAHQDVQRMIDLWIEIMGPVAPARVADAHGSATLSHAQMARIVASAVMRYGYLRTQYRHGVVDGYKESLDQRTSNGVKIDLDDVRHNLCHWIAQGCFAPLHQQCVQGGEDLRDLMAQSLSHSSRLGSVFNDELLVRRIRLGVVAPLGPALQTMIIIQKRDIQRMRDAQTSGVRKVSDLKVSEEVAEALHG